MIRVLAANLEDVMREAAARWTLIAYFFLSSIFIVIFASAINLDIVNGTLAGATLFGRQAQLRGSTIDIEQLVLGAESIFSIVLYALCTFMAIFATAHLVPRLQEKGTIDLYLARPVGRVRLLLSRYVAGLALAGINIAYLFGTIWLIVIWKTHVVNARFLLAGGINLFIAAAMLAFAFFIGVVTSSTAVSIMSTFAVALFGVPLYLFKHFEAAFSKQWEVWLTDAMYWTFPKTVELGQAVFLYVGGEVMRQQLRNAVEVNASAYITTGMFAIACLALASWLFTRKEF